MRVTHRWPYPKARRCATSVLCQYSSGLNVVRTKSAFHTRNASTAAQNARVDGTSSHAIIAAVTWCSSAGDKIREFGLKIFS